MARTVFGPQGSKSNTVPQGGAGGTLGGLRSAGRAPGARQLQLGDEIYLWILVIIEVLLMGWLRQNFRRHHGG